MIPTWNEADFQLPKSYNVNSNLGVLYSTLYYSEAIFNIGSTMALDAILLGKLAFYCHYKQPNGHKDFNIDRLYQFVHFKTFDKHPKAVHVLRSNEAITNMLKDFNTLKLQNTDARQYWAESVVAHPLQHVQQRMHAAFQKLLS